MRLRNIPTAREELAASPYVVKEEDVRNHRGCWRSVFHALRMSPATDDQSAADVQCAADCHKAAGILSAADTNQSCHKQRPLHIEIGMGKGRFLLEMARRNPDIDYIGIENYSSVLVHAVRKLDAFAESGESYSNLLLLRMNAEYLPDVFAPGEVDCIYLNFSDPWPKERHAKRRLPGRVFLERYSRVLAASGKVEFKTDNRSLFDFALEESKEAGWILDRYTYDLHHDPSMNTGNIMTEYEEKFSAMGNPICKLIEHP